ncbi:MAG TPA: molybdenum ABC transporter ATP-binding protein [Pontiella sp.]
MKLKIDIFHKQGPFVLDTNLLLEGSSIGIYGHSGSGKSTLLRCIAGLLRPSVGLIELNNETLFDSDCRVWVPPHKRRIGMVFQDAQLFPHWSVRKNLKSGKAKRTELPYTEEQVINLLQIAPLLSRSVQDLSGGEKQRISLARTLLSYPRLLLMDEPLSAMDARLKSRILPFLDRIHRELAIPTLIVSHDLSEILQLSDRLILLKEGHVAAYGTLDSVVAHDEMAELIQEKDLNQIIGHQLRGRDTTPDFYHERKISH